MNRAVFFDRDGVLVDDVGPIVEADQLALRDEALSTLDRLASAGYLRIVISNQAVVARGLLDEGTLATIHKELDRRLRSRGAPPMTAYYVCPHHPHADVLAYRQACGCRKPAPGLIQRACAEHGIEVQRSFMIGDRPSDVLAGQRAGCRTIWAQTGRHGDAPIVGMSTETIRPDFVCAAVRTAADWILGEARA